MNKIEKLPKQEPLTDPDLIVDKINELIEAHNLAKEDKPECCEDCKGRNKVYLPYCRNGNCYCHTPQDSQKECEHGLISTNNVGCTKCYAKSQKGVGLIGRPPSEVREDWATEFDRLLRTCEDMYYDDARLTDIEVASTRKVFKDFIKSLLAHQKQEIKGIVKRKKYNNLSKRLEEQGEPSEVRIAGYNQAISDVLAELEK